MTRKLVIIAALAMTVTCVLAERYLVRFSVGDQTLPDGWPVETSNALADDMRDVLKGWHTNWTARELKERIISLQPVLDAQEKAASDVREATNRTRITRLESLFDDFKAYADDWTAGTNYSNARLNKIVEDHNRAFLILRPILRDLYQSRE